MNTSKFPRQQIYYHEIKKSSRVFQNPISPRLDVLQAWLESQMPFSMLRRVYGTFRAFRYGSALSCVGATV